MTAPKGGIVTGPSGPRRAPDDIGEGVGQVVARQLLDQAEGVKNQRPRVQGEKIVRVQLYRALIFALLPEDALDGRDIQSIDRDERDLDAPIQIALLLDPDGFRDASLAANKPCRKAERPVAVVLITQPRCLAPAMEA